MGTVDPAVGVIGLLAVDPGKSAAAIFPDGLGGVEGGQ